MSALDEDELRIVAESDLDFEVHLVAGDGIDEDLSLATRATVVIRETLAGADLVLRTTAAADLTIVAGEALLRAAPLTAPELLLLPDGIYVGQAAIEIGGVDRWVFTDPFRVRIRHAFAPVLP